MNSSYKSDAPKIKQWAKEDRPREKFLKQGARALTTAELIAILFGSGTHKVSAFRLAQITLEKCNYNLHTLAKLSVDDLCQIKGIGPTKAIALCAAIELGKRRELSQSERLPSIKDSAHAANLLRPIIGDLPHEEFWVIYLNRSNRVIENSKVSSGGVAGTVVDIKIILKRAIELLASSLILIHNHPSGNLKPSQADMEITRKAKKAGALMDIQVLDHLIITTTEYYSFADEGRM